MEEVQVEGRGGEERDDGRGCAFATARERLLNARSPKSLRCDDTGGGEGDAERAFERAEIASAAHGDGSEEKERRNL